MEIVGKRKRSIARCLPAVAPGSEVVICLKLGAIRDADDLLLHVGFYDSVDTGATVIPDPRVGPVCDENALGRPTPTDRWEKVYHQVPWTHEEWRGRNRETVTTLVTRGYDRRVVDRGVALEVEVTILELTSGERILATPALRYEESNHDLLLHSVNLMLEVGRGRCDVVYGDLSDILVAPKRRMYWTLLPEGHRMSRRDFDEMIESIASNRPLVDRPDRTRLRFNTINRYQPDFYAVGNGGFSGYIAFGFTGRGLYLLESLFHGNATYVFGSNWQTLSQLSRTEIIDGGLATERIIHRTGWVNRINDLLG